MLLVDGWDELVSASDDHDGGRTAERVMNLLRSTTHAPVTAVVTGGRATLAPRLTTLATTRYVLALSDAGDYAAAGVPTAQRARRTTAGSRRCASATGRRCSSRVVDRSTPVVGEPAHDAIRVRPLPQAVTLAQLPARSGVVLGVYGDAAEIADVDLVGADARVLVAGPPRSGRTTALCTILQQSDGAAVIAAPRSPLAAAAARLGRVVVRQPADLPQRRSAAGRRHRADRRQRTRRR